MTGVYQELESWHSMLIGRQHRYNRNLWLMRAMIGKSDPASPIAIFGGSLAHGRWHKSWRLRLPGSSKNTRLLEGT